MLINKCLLAFTCIFTRTEYNSINYIAHSLASSAN